MPGMTANDFEGSCYCGRVRYRMTGDPRFVVHDHCSICRRVAGAAFVTWVGVKDEQFSLLAGGDELTTFASSSEATRQFCKHCGSHLFFRSSRWPGEVHVTLATLLAPEGLVAKAHVFFSDRAPWMQLDGALPKLGGPSGVEPLDS